MDERTFDADELVLRTAIRLFAELGYDATSMEMIAAAAGPAGSCSQLLRSGKPQIYRAVLQRFLDLEQASFAAAAKDLSPDIDGIHRLVDTTVDFSLAHPELISVWIHRGLKDAQDVGFSRRLAPKLNTLLTDIDWQGIRQDADLSFLGWAVVWMITGFARLGTDAPADRRRFRTQLHELVDSRLRP